MLDSNAMALLGSANKDPGVNVGILCQLLYQNVPGSAPTLPPREMTDAP